MAKLKKEKKAVAEQSIPMADGEKIKKSDKEPQTAVDEEEEEKKRKKKKKKEKIEAKIETVREQPDQIEQIEVKIETVHQHPDKIFPLIGYFPSGFDPLKNPSLGGQEHDPPSPQPRVGVFRHVKQIKRLQLVVSPNGSQVDFVGTSYLGEAAAPQVCTYSLGVLDKATQTLKIVPITANKIFRLDPRVRESEPSDIVKEELTTEKKADKLRVLKLMYSTKTTRTQTKRSEALHQAQDPKSQEELGKKLDNVKINKEALEDAAATTNNTRNIPFHDMSATTPQMAYPLDKIIFKGEWDYLLDVLKLSEVGAEVAPDVYPSFVCNRVHKLEVIKDEGERQTLACIFSYITHLIKFKDKHSMDGVSSVKHHKIPSILFQKFSTMFLDFDSNRLSDDNRDLLVSYVLVLALFADDFRSDLSDIARDLRINAVALRRHYEHLGCKLVREGLVLLATLPVPLQFPRLKRKLRRR